MGKEDKTPICPMPALTLRQSFPMASPMAFHNADSDGCPVPGTSVAARTMDIIPIPARRPFSQSCKDFSNASLPGIGTILRRVRSDGCPTSGASVAAHIEVQLEKRLKRIAGALERFKKCCSRFGRAALCRGRVQGRKTRPGRSRALPGLRLHFFLICSSGGIGQIGVFLPWKGDTIS